MATVKAIKYGMKGDDVANLQTTLNNLGYSLDVDGSFGPQTLAAVKKYQQANGLDTDGMVGPQTQAALSGANKGSTADNASNNKPASTSAKNTGSGSSASASTKVKYPTNFSYDDFSYGDFNYGGYQESETVAQAGAALDALLAAQPGAYQSKWQTQLDGIINQILNRKAFSYDFNEDALYKQYAEQYTRRGKLAMQDTMGQAAAMTGGYGSSYASTAGNQAYQEYLSQLNDVIPELYGMALDRYQMEGQEMYNQYGMLSAQEQQDYARYMDDYNKWLQERDYATGRYDSERDYDYSKYIDDRNYEYGKYVDDRNYAYGVYSDDKNYAYNDYLNEINKAQFDAEYAEKIRQYEENLKYQKDRDAVSDSQWTQSFGEQQKQNEISNEQWETSRQDKIDSENKANAREDVLAIIANGGTPNERQLKLAGWTKEQAQAYAKASSASASGKSITEPDKIDEWSSAILDAKTEEEALVYIERLEQLDPNLADALYEKWLKEHGFDSSTTDTTVTTKQNYTGGGGGRITQRAW